MSFGDTVKSFLKKQFIDVIHWTEPEDGILAWRFPLDRASTLDLAPSSHWPAPLVDGTTT